MTPLWSFVFGAVLASLVWMLALAWLRESRRSRRAAGAYSGGSR